MPGFWVRFLITACGLLLAAWQLDGIQIGGLLSLVLAVLGGTASLVIARWTLSGIMALLPAEATQTMEFSMSMPAVWFTAGLSLTTGLLFGIVPALQSTRPDLVTELRNNSGKLSGSRAAARFRASRCGIVDGPRRVLTLGVRCYPR